VTAVSYAAIALATKKTEVSRKKGCRVERVVLRLSYMNYPDTVWT
jgi:hypothetical protein